MVKAAVVAAFWFVKGESGWRCLGGCLGYQPKCGFISQNIGLSATITIYQPPQNFISQNNNLSAKTVPLSAINQYSTRTATALYFHENHPPSS
ncbi:hypothetical protein [Bacillus sp. THAF10]|uniref:hypothetical protein n=1 Tax=Bacillus sp. THAF10 TaxID=2587848 RepID=UPI001C12B91B|nr:hypothetical protein [Bacillus sp. THAF10]